MQYSKPMIDIVMEVRRRVPSNLKPGVKLANPDMLQELASYYAECKDTITRTLIKELMLLAGSHWPERLLQPVSTPAPRAQVKVYRGQVSLSEPSTTAEPSHDRPLRVYRGQVIRG